MQPVSVPLLSLVAPRPGRCLGFEQLVWNLQPAGRDDQLSVKGDVDGIGVSQAWGGTGHWYCERDL